MGKSIEKVQSFSEKMNCNYAICLYAGRIQEQAICGEFSNKNEIFSKGLSYIEAMIDFKKANSGIAPFLFLTNLLLDSFKETSNRMPKIMNNAYADMIESSLLDFYEGATTGDRAILDKPITLYDDRMTEMIRYATEVNHIIIFYKIVMGSRTKKDKATIDYDLLNDLLGHIDAQAIFAERLAQVRQYYFTDNDGNIGIWYCSQGILPLVWCEIKFCIEKRLRFKACPYCGHIYVCPPNNPNKGNCGDTQCRNIFIQDRAKAKHGEHWEAERKKKGDTIKGAKGRRKSKKRLEAEAMIRDGVPLLDIELKTKARRSDIKKWKALIYPDEETN